jgi:hypothetical protein
MYLMGTEVNAIGYSKPTDGESFMMLIAFIMTIVWLVAHYRNYQQSVEVTKEYPAIMLRERQEREALQA